MIIQYSILLTSTLVIGVILGIIIKKLCDILIRYNNRNKFGEDTCPVCQNPMRIYMPESGTKPYHFCYTCQSGFFDGEEL